MEAKKKLIWIVAAGTGGHIFPGLSLAQELKLKDPSFDFLFFGTKNRLESKLVPQAGYPLKTLRASQWKGMGFLSRFQTLIDLAIGFFQVFSLYLSGARPLCLIGVGGYVSVPVSLVAILFRVPFFILEPNICSGVSNRLLSRFARKAFTVPGSDALKKLKCEVLDYGNPIRSGLSPVEIRTEVKKILLLGGSQGAAKLTEAMLKTASRLGLAKTQIQVKIQCGEKNLENAQKLHSELSLGNHVQVVPFIQDVVSEISSSDVIISRAGAMSVAEISAAGVPTIFVPFPFAADDHQKKNAELLEKDGAALMVLEGENFEERLGKALLSLSLDPGHFEKRRALHSQMARWGRPRAGAAIAEKVLGDLSL